MYLTVSVCCRHTAIKEEGRVLLHLKDGPAEPEVVSVPKHKKHPPAGTKATRVGPQPPCASESVFAHAYPGALLMIPHIMLPY